MNAPMTHTLEALHGFFDGFLPAWAEGCAPDAAEMPYITYQLAMPKTGESAGLYARVWTREDGYADIAAVVDAIAGAIGPGCALATEGGAVWLYQADRFAQFTPVEGDPRIRCAYLSMKLVANTL